MGVLAVGAFRPGPPRSARRTPQEETPTWPEQAGKGDNPPMLTTRADEKRRVTLPDAKPGDRFEIRRPGNGDFILVRLPREPRMSRAESLEAMAKTPFRMRMSWEELRRLTREP